jgi:hypothetical protein
MARPPSPDHEAREAARARGDKRYLSTRPCLRGHFDFYVSGKGCYVCMIAAQRLRYIAKPKAPRPVKEQPFRKSAKLHAARIEAAPRFRGKHIHDLAAADANSPEGRSRSAHLDALVKGIVAVGVLHAPPKTQSYHQFKKVAR